MSLVQISYLFILALVLAALEVQIEGADGWAAKLPCWRPRGRWYVKIYSKVLSGKEVTGYHVFVFLFAFLMLHLPYVWGVPWTAHTEFQTLSVFFLFVVVWDFLWFVINPHFGVRKFHPGCATWHKIWLGPAPVDYFGALTLSFLFHVLRVYVGAGVGYGAWGLTVLTFVLLTIFVVIITELIKKFKRT